MVVDKENPLILEDEQPLQGVVGQGLVGGFNLVAAGDVVQEQQAAPAGGEGGQAGFEVARPGGGLQAEGGGRAVAVEPVEQGRPGGQGHAGRLADGRGPEIEQPAGGRVEIDQAILGIEDEDAIPHMFDEDVAGNGAEVEQVVAKEAPGDNQVADGEGEGGDVPVEGKGDAGHGQGDAGQGDEEADQDGPNLAAVEGAGVDEAVEEEDDAVDQQGIAVEDDGQIDRGEVVEEGIEGVAGDEAAVGADQVIDRIGQEEQPEDEEGQAQQEQASLDVGRGAPAVFPGKGQEKNGQQQGGDELEIIPEDFTGQGGAEKLEDEAGGPQGLGQGQAAKGGGPGHAPPSPGIEGQAAG